MPPQSRSVSVPSWVPLWHSASTHAPPTHTVTPIMQSPSLTQSTQLPLSQTNPTPTPHWGFPLTGEFIGLPFWHTSRVHMLPSSYVSAGSYSLVIMPVE